MPDANPTPAQLETLDALKRDRPGQGVTIHREPFGLPAGYLLVVFSDGFEVGIAPDGRGSS